VIWPNGKYEDVLRTSAGKSRKSHGKETRKERRIEDALTKGQEVLVQINRETLDHKGPSLTMFPSMPGRYLVLMPVNNRRGISRKITDESVRNELKKALDQLNPPKDYGFIIRTAGYGKGKEELENDLASLTSVWEGIKKRASEKKSPCILHQEGDLSLRVLRDYLYEDVSEILIDDAEEYVKAKAVIESISPDFAGRLKLYENGVSMFSKYGVDKEIDKIFDRSTRLPSGGEIIIEQTEALVAIDVNTGKFKRSESSREMILVTNKEAAVEIARQLRLRDLGGLVMIDFIDMEEKRDREEIENVFRQAMKTDRAKVSFLPISKLGVMEMSRQRLRQSLKKTLYRACPSCRGSGVVKGDDPLALDFLRKARLLLEKSDSRILRVHLAFPSLLAVANSRREELYALEKEKSARILLAPDDNLPLGEMRFEWLEEE
jgi:ribonuclease E